MCGVRAGARELMRLAMSFREKKYRNVLCAVALSIAASTANGGVAHDPSLNWHTLHTSHFRVHFHDGLDDLAVRAGAVAEKAHERLTQTVRWSPDKQTDIVITDEVDFANGFTTPLPGNHVELWVTPPSDGLDEFGSWLDALITHEYTHVLHLDAVDDTPAAWRKVFGRHPLLFPDLWQPDWIVEGIATHLEGADQKDAGRGQSSYFDMMMRMEVASGVKPLAQANLPIDTWPAGTARYLYGVSFMRFVAKRYGDDALRNWIIRYRGNLIPFMINTNSRRTLNKSLDELWDEFTQDLNERYRPELARIEAEGLREGVPLTTTGYASGRPRVGVDGGVFYIRSDGRTPLALVKLSANKRTPTVLAEINAGARFDLHPERGLLLAQPEQMRNARVHYDLYRLDADGRSMRRLTTGGRFHQAVWSRDGAWIYAVRQSAGRSSLHLLDSDGVEQATLWQGGDQHVLSDIAIDSAGAKLATTMWREGLGWQLAEFDLNARTWRFFTQPGVTPVDVAYAPRTNAILYAANVGGVFNIWSFDTRSGERRQLTRVRGGAFAPSMGADGRLVYAGYAAGGLDIYSIDANATPLTAAVERVAVDEREAPPAGAASPVAFNVTDYTPATGVEPTWWSPLWAVTSDMSMVGATTGGTDPLRRHAYAATAAYDFKNEIPLGSLVYLYDGWTLIPQLIVNRDIGLHRSSNDVLAAVTTDNAVVAVLSWPWIKQRTQWALHVGAAYERESVESVAPGFRFRAARDDQLVGAAVTFNSTRRPPLSISRGFGRDVVVAHEDSDIGMSDYRGNVTTADWREFFNPGGEHVAAVRMAYGWGVGDPRYFQLGGALSTDVLLSNDIIGASSPFNRRDYGLRGYSKGLAQLSGRRMELVSAEWRMPLMRIERTASSPPVGIHQWYATLFSDSGAAWNDGNAPSRLYSGSGVELNFDTALFYRARVDIVVGYAHGWDEELGEDQWYARLGSAF